jgi:large subunit ribosomal protein L31
MKRDLHPKDYRPVIFRDTNSGALFLTKSTAASAATVKWQDGREYPVIDVHITSASHPFYTGKEKLVDIEGRVDRFKAKTEQAKQLRAKAAGKHAKDQRRVAAKKQKQASKR